MLALDITPLVELGAVGYDILPPEYPPLLKSVFRVCTCNPSMLWYGTHTNNKHIEDIPPDNMFLMLHANVN